MPGGQNAGHVTPRWLSERFGIRVDRTAAALPAAQAALFTVSGGRVLITGVLGEVMVAILAQACTLKLTSNPTTGTDVDIAAASASVSGKEIGSLFGITGLFATAMNVNNAGATGFLLTPVVLPIGTLDITPSADNSATGTVRWSIWYIPLDPLAKIVAA